MRLLTVLATLMVSTLTLFASATTYRELSLEQLVSRAELGFFGRVSEMSVEVRGGEPYTQVTFSISRALTGDFGANIGGATEGDTVTLAFYGGTLPNGRSVSVEGMPEFSRGDEVLILAYDAPYYSPIVGFSQGLWRATPDGFRDLDGRLLSLSDTGRLLRDGEGSEQTAVLDELEARLGAAR